MTGDYDKDSKTVRWKTEAKDPNGKPIVQKTMVTQKSADERVLVLSVPGKRKNDFTKFMQIRFVKRKQEISIRILAAPENMPIQSEWRRRRS